MTKGKAAEMTIIFLSLVQNILCPKTSESRWHFIITSFLVIFQYQKLAF